MKQTYTHVVVYKLRLYVSLIVAALSLFFTGLPDQVRAQRLDTSFKPDLYANTTNGEVKVIQLQPDGKLLVAGNFTKINGTELANIARINPDGSVDKSFNPGPSVNFTVHAVALLPGGRVLVGGYYGRLVCLSPSGDIDASFVPEYMFDANPNNRVNSISIQQDGKVLIGGVFLKGGGAPTDVLIRLNPDGKVDERFTSALKRGNTIFHPIYNGVASILTQPDGKIVVGGTSLTRKDGITVPNETVIRLHADGTVDDSFNASFNRGSYVFQMALQSDGKIITLGNSLYRLNPNGNLDEEFKVNVTAYSLSSLALQPDGKILLAQRFNREANNGGIQDEYNIVRLFSSGTSDESFNPTMVLNNPVNTMVIRPDGKIFAGGSFTEVDGSKEQGLALFSTTGKLDRGFNTGEGIVTGLRIFATVVQPDGKILIAGDFDKVGGISRTGIARIYPDGSLDTSFDPGSGIEHTSMGIRTLKLLPDGKILIGGNFVSYNGIDRGGLARLHPDGKLDLTFTPKLGIYNTPTYAIAIQPDGKIVVGGIYHLENNKYSFIYRIHPDGSIDQSFHSDNGINNTIMDVALQPDGKILIGGHFTMIGGETRTRFARLNADGTLDNDFKPEIVSLSSESSFISQPDGKVIVGGFLRSADRSLSGPIARLNSDGSLDHFYSQAVGAVEGITLQPSGKLIINGSFNFSGGDTYYGLTRLNADFSLDEGFDTYGKQVKPNYSFSFQRDGKMLLGGIASHPGITRFNIMQRVALPKSQKITFPDLGEMVEGREPLKLQATASSGLPVSFEVVSGPATLAGDLLTITGAGKLLLRANQTGNADWEPAPSEDKVICVIPRKPTITVDGTTLTSSSNRGNQWYRNGVAIEGATGKEFSFSQGGRYTVAVSIDECTSHQSEAYLVAPKLLTIRIASDNANPARAKTGDVVTIGLTANEAIQAPTVVIAGHVASVTPVGTSSNQFTAQYTMTAAIAEGAVSFNISFRDEAGNAGTDATATTDGSSVIFDKTSPFPTITSTVGGTTNKGTIPLTLTFSEAVTGLEASDFNVVNGSVSRLSTTNNVTYTMDFTPTGSGAVSVALPVGKVKDAASNLNTASNTWTASYDGTRPTVALSTQVPEVTNKPFTVSLTFSKAVTGFTVSDITVENGTASGFVTKSGTTYEAKITPAGQGQVRVSVAADVAQDAAKNGNMASSILTRIYDSLAPTGYAVSFNQTVINYGNESSASVKVTGAEVGATYSYAITSAGGGTAVSGTGQVGAVTFDIPNLNLSGLGNGQLTLVLRMTDAASNAGPEAKVQVMKHSRNLNSYTRPAEIRVPFRTTFGRLKGQLPSQVEVTYSDNAKGMVSVVWQEGAYDGTKAGSYTLSGTLMPAEGTTNLDNIVASVTVVVEASRAATAIALSRSDVDENNKVGAVIGTLSASDPDEGDTHTYTLVEGEGSADNASFTIEGDVLKSAVTFDYESKKSYTIRIRTTDSGGASFEAVHIISINDVEDVVTGIAEKEDQMLKIYPNPTSRYLVVSFDKVMDAVSLVNGTGSVVLRKEGRFTQARLDTEALAPGVYILMIHAHGKIYTKRIVVTK